MIIKDTEYKEIKDKRYRGACWFCGGKMVWESDFNLDEVLDLGVLGDPEDQDGVVAFLHCSKCGSEQISIIRNNDEE